MGTVRLVGLHSRVPAIKFRSGGRAGAAKPSTAPTDASAAPSAPAASAAPAAAAAAPKAAAAAPSRLAAPPARAANVVYIDDDRELPPQYHRQALSDSEIDNVNSGGGNVFDPPPKKGKKK